MMRRLVPAASLCLSLLAPALAAPAPRVEAVAVQGGTAIRHRGPDGGWRTLRVTGARVERLRLAADPRSGQAAVLWDEVSGTASQPWFALPDAGPALAEPRPARTHLPLRHGRLEPGVSEPEVPASLRAPGGRVFIVQLQTVSTDAWRDGLEALGAEVLAYLPHQSHVVRMDPAAVPGVAALPYVRWVGPFHPAYRIDPALGIAREGDAPRAVNVVAFREGAAAQGRIARAVEAAGGRVLEAAPDGGGFVLRAELTRAQVGLVARSDDVQWIDAVLEPRRLMDVIRPFHGATALEAASGFSGQGVAGEVLDWGTDLAHQDFDGIQPHPGQGVTSDPHGTCTYGIVFGNGDRDGDGDARATGMMPSGAGFAAQMTTMGNRKLHTEALLHAPMFCVFQSNSWATGLTGTYNSYSFELDDIAFTFDLPITQAMANSSLNTLVSSQAWAKNVIAVGGIKHRDTLTTSDDTWGVAGCPDCGSTGPAEDGSIKPDLASFFDRIYTADAEPGGYGPGPYETSFGGTSGATAITAGAVGLLHQMWADGIFGNVPAGTTVFESRPHAVTVRAMLQNRAFRYPIGSSPALGVALRSQQGWGLPNVQRLYDDAPRMNVVDESVVLAAGGRASYCISIPAGTPELAVTMSYLDPPGVISSVEHRVNDLSLTVTDPSGTVYHGNAGLAASNLSSPGGAKDTLNVTEHVLLASPAPGSWRIVVDADEVNADAHRETADVDVDFALVVTGVRCPGLSCCGNVDVVTGPGPGTANPPRVRGFDLDGTPNGLTDFAAYGVSQHGVNVATGNVRTTSPLAADLLTGPGPGPVFGPQVRGFARDGAPLGKINFYAYGTLKFGVNASSGDVDADAYDEILTAPGPGAVFGPHVRGFDVDNAVLAPLPKASFYAFATLRYGARAVTGDVEGDAFAELLASPGPSSVFAAQVRGFDYDGAAIGPIAKLNFLAGSTRSGAHVAGGDLDGDGIDEIVAAPGPDPAATARIRGFDYDGVAVAAIAAVDFDGMPGRTHGASVASVDLDADGFAEMVVGTGYDPAAPPRVRGFDYDGASVAAIPALDFDAYAPGQPYGVNVAADEVGP